MKLFFLFFLLISSCCISQTAPLDYTLIDNRVTEISSCSPDTLAQNLTAVYVTDIEKVRSIFKWITENIAYDTKGYYNLNKIYHGLFQLSSSLDSATVYKNYNDNIVRKVLREKVAICDGYSRLFKTLCDYANIKSEIVTGYIRWYSDSIGEQTKRIHAWNAVQINNKWYLLDATWASGYSNAAVTNFKKEYDDYYFLTPPDKLINDHFPLDSKWTLISHPLTINEFYNQPYLFPAFRKYKIKSYKPSEGLIVTKVGSKISFELETDEHEKEIDVVASLIAHPANEDFDSDTNINISSLLTPKFTVAGDKVAYIYNIKSAETKELNVIYKGELAMRYRVRLEN
jgi:transglutaminase/protease-like cytokinesis protein 3